MNKSQIIGAVTCGALLATLTASAGEAPAPNEIINSFADTFDVRSEQHTENGNCICAAGEFIGTPVASALSRSALFTQVPIPVVARFSAARGNPNNRNSLEMSLEFRLPGGSLQHMAMLNTPVFATSDPVAFEAMIAAVKPHPDTGTPDLQRLREFIAAHPHAFAQSNFVTAINPPSSFAGSAYFSIHTFRFIDAEGRTRFVKWRFLPQDGQPTTSPSGTAQDAVQEGFIKRLASGPVRWDMIVYVGEPADSTDNASIAWPEERMHLKAGTLTITKPTPENAAQCAELNFDPLISADGIAPADDPVLLFRSPVYARTFSEILAQALESMHTPPVVAQ
jgi:catalase